MERISISDARRLLELPAHGRVSRQRLDEAYQKEFRSWTSALNSAIGGSERQRARDVLRMLLAAHAVLKVHPTAKRTKPPSVRKKGHTKQPKVTICHPTYLLKGYRTLRKAIEGTATTFDIPKTVVVLVLVLFVTLIVQGGLGLIAGAISSSH